MKEEKLELFKLPNWEGWHQEIFGSCKELKNYLSLEGDLWLDRSLFRVNYKFIAYFYVQLMM
ncbi:12350_t:CDS:2 [Rhizophagus irregularis]|nr:12350_t:CDS:2 [Rhizophagus irregularis]